MFLLILMLLNLIHIFVMQISQNDLGSNSETPSDFTFNTRDNISENNRWTILRDGDEDIFYTFGCKTNPEICSPCHICVNNECLPFSLDEIYYENCTMINKCTDNKNCEPFMCKTSYGVYICQCPPNRYGKHCSMTWTSKRGNITLSDVQVVYPQTVAASDSVPILVSWLDTSLSSNSRDISITYSVEGDNFSDSVVFNKFRFMTRKNPQLLCMLYKILPESHCSVLPFSDIYTVLQFNTEFPFIGIPKSLQNSTNMFSSSNVAHDVLKEISLPGGRSILGYTITFKLQIVEKETLFYLTTQHVIFIYYKNQYAFQDECFPFGMVTKKPCGSQIASVSGLADNRVSRKDRVVLKGDIANQACKNVLYTYTVWNDEYNFDRMSTLYNKNASVLIIQPFELSQGYYRVKITATSRLKDILSSNADFGVNFIICWFEVVQLPLVANIAGGDSRTVYALDDLVLDASHSTDPNNPLSRQQSLFFQWSCNETDHFCVPYITKARQYVIKAPLRAGVTFLFKLKVYAYRSNEAYDNQTIETTNIKFNSFLVQCLRNCYPVSPVSNPDKIIYLQVNVTGKLHPEDSYTWSYTYQSNINLPTTDIQMNNTEPYVIIVEPAKLPDNEQFSFTANRIRPLGAASIMVTTGKRPSIHCEITPHQGMQMQTSFTVSCFSDHPDPLQYTFYGKLDNNTKDLPIYFGYTSTGKVDAVRLYYEHVYVRATVVDTGCFSTKVMKVQLSEFTELNNSSKGREIIKKALKQLNRNPSVLWRGPYGGYLNLIVMVNHYYQDHNMDLVFTWDDVFYVLIEVVYKTPYDFIRFLSCLTRIIQMSKVPVFGLSPKTESTVYIISKVVAKLMKTYDQYIDFFHADLMLSTDDVMNIASALFSCHSFLIDSLSFSQQSNIHFKNALRNKHFTPRILLTGVGRTTSTQLYIALRGLTMRLAESLILFINSLAKRLLPMERAFFLHHRNYTVFVKVDSPNFFKKFRKIPLQKSNSYIKIASPLAQELLYHSPFIKLQLVVLDKNSYWWDRDESIISTQLLYVAILAQNLKSSNTWYNVINLQHPMDIFLYVVRPSYVEVNGAATLPSEEASPSDQDSAVTVYRVTPPRFGGGGKLFIHFFDIPSTESLRVVMTSNFRPDLNYMKNYGTLIDNQQSKLSLAYDMNQEHVFLYIGILPGPSIAPLKPVKFKFEAYIVRCVMRIHSMWTTEKCLVANKTTGSVIHCQCRLLALAGAGVELPQVLLSSIANFEYSYEPISNWLPPLFTLLFLMLFALFTLWAFYKEWCLRRVSKDKVVVLEDNFPGEEWAYLLGVYTGTRYGSGTSSNVAVKLNGELSESRAHILRCSNCKTLQTYSDDWFLMFTTEKLGTINSLHVWLDFSGNYPSWYCRKVVVYDCSAKVQYVFRLATWFTVDHNSELMEMQVSPLLHKNISFYSLLLDNLIYAFQEKHYIIAITHHHPRSFLSLPETMAVFFTTVAFTAFILLIYYKYDNKGVEDYPFYQFSYRDLMIACLFHIPALFISVLCQFFFRNKVVTSHMSTWKIVSKKLQQIKTAELILAEETKDEENKIEEKEKDESDFVIDEEKKGNRVLWNVKNIFSIKRLPLTIAHEAADQVHIVRKRQFVAWSLVMAVFSFSILLMVVEGHTMAWVKSNIWLTVCLVSTIIGVTFSVTLRTLIQMFIITLVMKKSYDEPQFSCDPRLGMRLELVGDRDNLESLLVLRSQPEYRPLSTNQIMEIKSEREKKIFWIYIMDIILIVFVYVLVLIHAMNSWPPQDFLVSRHLMNLLVHSETNPRLTDIDSLSHLGDFLKNSLSDVFNQKQWYNGDYLDISGNKFTESGWMQDNIYRMIGVVQIRQKRVIPEPCVPLLMRHLFSSWRCKSYIEDTSNYSLGWSPVDPNERESAVTTPWQHQSLSDQTPVIQQGKSGRKYSRGGYVINLSRTLQLSKTILWKMDEAGWVSKLTEVLFIDASVYNPNVNKISVISVCLEMKPTGGFFITLRVVNTAIRHDYLQTQTVVWIFLLIVFLVLLFKLILLILQQGVPFLLNIWNLMDLGIVILYMLNFAFGVTNVFLVIFGIENNLNTARENFVIYGWVEYHGAVYILLYTFLLVLCSLRLFKHWIQPFRVSVLLTTLRLASDHLYKVFILFTILLFLQFYALDALLFNSQITLNCGTFLTFPLLNRLSLKNYSNNFTFPDHKWVPFIYCVICVVTSAVFTILLIYHYRLAGHTVLDTTHGVRRRRQRGWHRLRAGVDSRFPLLARSDLCLKSLKDLVNTRVKCDRSGRPVTTNVLEILTNIDHKLDKILSTLKHLSDSLV